MEYSYVEVNEIMSNLNVTLNLHDFYNTFNDIAPSLLKQSVNEEFRYLCSQNGFTLKIIQILEKCVKTIQSYAKDIQFEIDEYTQYNVQVDDKVLDTITNCCRLLRNLCANCNETKIIMDDYNLVFDLLPLFTNIQLWGLGELSWSTKYELFIQVCVQMICNYVTLYSQGQTLVWKYYFPGVFNKLYSHYKHIRKIIGYTNALIYNSICDVDKKDKYIDIDITIDTNDIYYSRIYALSKEKELMNRILTNLLINEEDKDVDDAYTYGVYIIEKFFQYITIQEFYESLLSTKYPIVSPSQLLLLHIFYEYTLDKPTYKFRIQNYYFLCDIFPQFFYSLQIPADIYTYPIIYTYSSLIEENKEVQITLAREAFGIVYSMLSNYPNTFSDSIRHQLYNNNIQNITIAILKIPSPISEKNIQAAAKEGIIIPQAPDFVFLWPKDIRTSAMKMLCNLSYQNKEIQDLVRTQDCLIHILDNMKIDQTNPTLREWTLFTIRNLCDNNEENQKAISDIKLERVQVQEPLQKLNVK